MSKVNKLKDETNKMVHSLLVASGQEGQTLRELERNFQQLIGDRIPYRALGYVNVEDYLRGYQDFFRLFWKNNQLYVRHVSREDTQQLERMIANQKKPKRRRGGGGGGGFTSSAQRSRSRFEPKPSPPVVPAIVRGQIKELLFAYHQGMPAGQFELAFAKRFGRQLDCRSMRFENLPQMLKSMPDILRIESSDSGVQLFPRTGRPVLSGDKPTHPEQVQSQPHGQGLNRDVRLPQEEARTQIMPGNAEKEAEEEGEEEDDFSGISSQIKFKIQQVMEKHPEGVWSSRFQAEYKVVHNENIDIRGLGYQSVIELMSALSDVVTIEREDQRDWKLYDVRSRKKNPQPEMKSANPEPAASRRQDASLTTAPPVSDDLKQTILQVVTHFPDGVLLAELEDKFYELTGEALLPRSHGFSSLEVLVVSLSDVLQMQYRGLGQIMLYAVNSNKPENEDRLKRLNKKQRPKRQVPSDAVGPGVTFDLQLVEKENQYVEVYVSNVSSPSRFWIQIKGLHTTEALEYLMDELEVMYADPDTADLYEMPDRCISVGLVCVAVYPEDGNWHRVQITTVHPPDHVEVYYFDYGSSCTVQNTSLKLMRSQFLKLPAQALMARLANTQPIGETWTMSARNRMLHMVRNKPLIAYVTNVDERNTISVCLCDTSGEEDVHVNDTLITEHMARFHPDDYNVDAEFQSQVSLETGVSQMGPDGDHVARQDALESSSRKSSLDEEQNCTRERYVKLVHLPGDYRIHVIRLEDKGYVTSTEVSGLLWAGKDLLRSMLRQRKVNVPKLILPANEHVDMFEEFKAFEVEGTLSTDGEIKTHATLYELSNVVEILELFGHASEELKAAVQQQVDLFNPNDSYWKDAEESDFDDDEDDDLDVEVADLESTLQQLQLRRGQILKSLGGADAVKVGELVEEMQQVEHQVRDVKRKLLGVEERNRAGRAAGSEKSGSTKLSAEEHLINQVVMEQDDDYVTKSGGGSYAPPPPEAAVLPETPSRQGVKTNAVAPMPTPGGAADLAPAGGVEGALASQLLSALSLGSAGDGGQGSAALRPLGSASAARPLVAGAGSSLQQQPQELTPAQAQILQQYQVLMQQVRVMNNLLVASGAPRPADMDGLGLPGDSLAAKADLLAMGTGAMGTGAMGTGAMGSGTMGSGTMGTGAMGSGTMGTGAMGTSSMGTGAMGSGTMGTGAMGSGAMGTGTMGTGAMGTGALGSTSLGPASCSAMDANSLLGPGRAAPPPTSSMTPSAALGMPPYAASLPTSVAAPSAMGYSYPRHSSFGTAPGGYGVPHQQPPAPPLSGMPHPMAPPPPMPPMPPMPPHHMGQAFYRVQGPGTPAGNVYQPHPAMFGPGGGGLPRPQYPSYPYPLYPMESQYPRGNPDKANQR